MMMMITVDLQARGAEEAGSALGSNFQPLLFRGQERSPEQEVELGGPRPKGQTCHQERTGGFFLSLSEQRWVPD